MARMTLSQFISGQLEKVPPLVTADLTGKTVMVVGANTGLGFEAAKHFARMNAGRLILACRSPSRGKAAAERKLLFSKNESRLIGVTSRAQARNRLPICGSLECGPQSIFVDQRICRQVPEGRRSLRHPRSECRCIFDEV
jgi:hypothetical protein